MSELETLRRAAEIARSQGSSVIRRQHLTAAERESGVTVKVER